MIRKTTKYTDFNGHETEEAFYFNLSKPEVMELNHEYEGGLDAAMQRIIDRNDNYEIYNFFKNLMLKAYGEKSADGRSFVKTAEATKRFEQSTAFETILFGILEDENNGYLAAEFVNGILPESMKKDDGEVRKLVADATK